MNINKLFYLVFIALILLNSCSRKNQTETDYLYPQRPVPPIGIIDNEKARNDSISKYTSLIYLDDNPIYYISRSKFWLSLDKKINDLDTALILDQSLFYVLKLKAKIYLPVNPEHLKTTQYNTKELDSADKYFQLYRNKAPNDLETNYYLALIEYYRGNGDEVINLISKNISNGYQDSKCDYLLGMQYYKNCNLEQSYNYLLKAFNNNGNILNGFIIETLNKDTTHLSNCLKINQNIGNDYFHFFQGIKKMSGATLSDISLMSNSILELTQVRDYRNQPSILMLIGIGYSYLKKYETAKEYIESAFSLNNEYKNSQINTIYEYTISAIKYNSDTKENK